MRYSGDSPTTFNWMGKAGSGIEDVYVAGKWPLIKITNQFQSVDDKIPLNHQRNRILLGYFNYFN